MSYGKHKVEHIINKTPSLSTNANGNTVLVGADGAEVVLPAYPQLSAPRNRILKRGSKLLDPTIATNWTRSGAGVVFSPSQEWSRRSSSSLKIDMLSASADAVLTWSNATGIVADPTDKLISLDLYVPKIVQGGISHGTVSVSIHLSNNTTYGGAGSNTWVVNANYLRQGMNEIRLCGKDANGAVASYHGTGTLPFGMSKATSTTDINWSLPIKYISIQITYLSSQPRVFYLGEIRIPAKIKPFLCLGFDASGSTIADDIFLDRTAPFLSSNSIPCYFTNTWVYDGLYQGSADDTRRQTLYDTWGWEAVNHTWSHGASVPGTLYASGNTLVVSGTGTLATLTLSGAHGWTIGSTVLVAVFGATGASAAGANGVFAATVTTTTAVAYAITGGADGTATGTVQCSTYLGHVFNWAAWTNQPIVLGSTQLTAALSHEVSDINSYGRSKGWLRGSQFLAYPNNSVPDMTGMVPAAAAAGIKLARGIQGTTCRVSEFGVDNPLNVGSMDMSSGSTYGTTIADVTNALTGAINRGEGLFLFGHFLRDEALDAVVSIDSPPGMGGNPAAPGTSPDLWWYAGQLEKFLTTVAIPLRDAGELDFVSTEELVATLGVSA